jgi:Abortive infection C-terminus
MKKKENLPYRVFELACSMFLHKFTHSGMEAFFCSQMNKHPNDLSIPPGLNRSDKFKWFLGQLDVQEQKRVLEELCGTDDPQVLADDCEKLLQMLNSSPIQIPPPAPGNLDTQYISGAWEKARARRHEDPEGAITAARTLLESVCKHILDECGVEYGDNADLPKLYGLTSKELNLAPSQHTEDAFKKILGGAHSVVDGLANLRNRLGDAHGQGKRPVKPLARHAELAVNMAGSVASFLLATFEAKRP